MNKKEIRDYLILFLNIILIVFLTTKFSNLFGSDTDWINQHTIIPDYFRQTFYNTGKLLPNLAFNYGGGQNIFNLSYYGLLSPIVLISYLFPFLSMQTYTIIANIIILMITSVLFYKWIKSHGFDDNITLITSLIFTLAPPLIFQMHRHMMFVNYMPFLIMSLIGVDKYLKYKNKTILILGIFLMIMTSYYYSVCGIIVVSLYYLYRYIDTNNNFTFKQLIINGIKYVLLIFIGISMAGILLIPTAYTLLQGRGESTSTISLIQLLTPHLKIYKLFNGPYSIGVSMIGFVSLLYLFYTKKKSNIVFATSCSIIIFMPIFMYILNGGLYLREKCFIPFIPVFGYMIAVFLSDLYNKKINTKKFTIFLLIILIPLYYYKEKQLSYLFFIGFILLMLLIDKKKYIKTIMTLYIVLVALGMAGYEALNEKFVSRDMLNKIFDKNIEKEINDVIDSDTSFYRSNNLMYPTKTVNKIYNQRYYTTAIYSSTYNKNYLKFLRDTFKTSMLEYNYFLVPASNNILFNTFMGVKYSFSDYDLGIGYTKINNNTYLNKEAFPIIYASNNLLNIKEFSNYSYPYQTELLLKNVIVEDDSYNKNSTTINKENITYQITLNDGVVIEKDKNNDYVLKVEDKGHLKVVLDKELNNKFLFININGLKENRCGIADNISMTINNVENILTCKTWPYPNKNNNFKFVISDKNINTLNIELTKGTYNIKDIEMYTLDYDNIKGRKKDLTNFNLTSFDNDAIKGTINITEDNSYLVTSIPYDKGYTIKVDDAVVKYKNINKGFIGLPISKGNHNVEISYKAPYLNVGISLSIVGFLTFVVIIVIDKKQNKQHIFNTKKINNITN